MKTSLSVLIFLSFCLLLFCPATGFCGGVPNPSSVEQASSRTERVQQGRQPGKARTPAAKSKPHAKRPRPTRQKWVDPAPFFYISWGVIILGAVLFGVGGIAGWLGMWIPGIVLLLGGMVMSLIFFRATFADGAWAVFVGILMMIFTLLILWIIGGILLAVGIGAGSPLVWGAGGIGTLVMSVLWTIFGIIIIGNPGWR